MHLRQRVDAPACLPACAGHTHCARRRSRIGLRRVEGAYSRLGHAIRSGAVRPARGRPRPYVSAEHMGAAHFHIPASVQGGVPSRAPDVARIALAICGPARDVAMRGARMCIRRHAVRVTGFVLGHRRDHRGNSGRRGQCDHHGSRDHHGRCGSLGQPCLRDCHESRGHLARCGNPDHRNRRARCGNHG